MNKEVYISGLEWTRTHDNMGGVVGNIVFKDNMHYEEYQRLTEGFFILCDKDYITNLQKYFNVKVIKYEELLEKYFNIQQRIDKAIEYIEKEYQDNIIITDYADNPITPQELYGELLNILKGDD